MKAQIKMWEKESSAMLTLCNVGASLNRHTMDPFILKS